MAAVDILEAETIDDLARRIAGASPETRNDAPAWLAVGPAVGPPQASSEQRRLWFMERAEAPSNRYIIAASFKLTGDVNATKLKAAAQKTIERHEILRTGYPAEAEGPRPLVSETAAVAISVVDLTGASSDAERAFLEDLAAAPFDLTRPPLFRLGLARVNEGEWRLGLAMHHIIGDARSLEILARELILSCSEASSPVSAALSYRDYAAWYREVLDAAENPALAYWTQKLRNLPQPEAVVKSGRSSRQEALMPSGLVQNLRAFSRQQNTTLFETLAAGLHFLLHRFFHQGQNLIAFSVHGRTRPEFDNIIGFLAYPLLSRVSIDPELSFAQLASEVSRDIRESMKNQNVSFSRILAAARSAGAPCRCFVCCSVTSSPKILSLKAVECFSDRRIL